MKESLDKIETHVTAASPKTDLKIEENYGR